MFYKTIHRILKNISNFILKAYILQIRKLGNNNEIIKVKESFFYRKFNKNRLLNLDLILVESSDKKVILWG